MVALIQRVYRPFPVLPCHGHQRLCVRRAIFRHVPDQVPARDQPEIVGLADAGTAADQRHVRRPAATSRIPSFPASPPMKTSLRWMSRGIRHRSFTPTAGRPAPNPSNQTLRPETSPAFSATRHSRAVVFRHVQPSAYWRRAARRRHRPPDGRATKPGAQLRCGVSYAAAETANPFHSMVVATGTMLRLRRSHEREAGDIETRGSRVNRIPCRKTSVIYYNFRK